MHKLAALVIVIAATASFAEQPSRETASQPLYVLRATVSLARPTTSEGIFQYDPASRTFTPFAPFLYYARSVIPGAIRLGATADRIVVQARQHYEFDLVTGRLLRRYIGSDAADDGWAFHGVVVTDELGRVLGIPSGTYGFPFCPTFISADPCCVTTCTARQFPGYSKPTMRPFSVLLRRSLDPSQTALSAVKVVSAESNRGTDPGVTGEPPHAAIALDSVHQQFWTWGATGASSTLWATLPIRGGVISDAMPVDIPGLADLWDVNGLTFHPPTQRLFDIVDLRSASHQLVQQSTAEPPVVTVLDESFMSQLPTPRVDAVTGVPEQLPDRYVQVIPAVGEVRGANGTFWRSDVWLYNPAETDVDVNIRRVTRPEKTTLQHLPAHGSVALRNALAGLGGGASGDGVTIDALVIDAPYRWGAQLAAYSRTFTGDTGTYGQSVPAVPSSSGYSTHLRWHDPYLISATGDGPTSAFVLDRRVPGRFRYNIGVVNDGIAAMEVRLSAKTVAPVMVAAHSVAIINVDSLFGSALPMIVGVEANRPAPIWMSAVDNITGDATFVPFETFAMNGGTTAEMAIPAIAATGGANGTSWRTDLVGMLPTTGLGQTTLATSHLDAANGCGADANLPADGPWIYADIARQFSVCSSGGSVTGALRINGSTWMAGYSRTYTTRADGGTYGDLLPFYPWRGWPVQHFSGIETGGSFRVNVGLYNGQSTTVTNRLLLYDANGDLVAQRDIDLASHASLQSPIASIMSLANLPAGLYGLTVNPLGEGRSWAYVSLVDNMTGDPTNLW